MTKRGNGEGSRPIQRKDGSWTAALRVGDGKRKYVYGKTRKEVQTKLREAQRAYEQGRLVIGQIKKTGQYLQEWLEGRVRLANQATTYDSYRCDVERLLPHMGNIRLDALRHEHIQQAYTELLAHLSPVSVHRVHRTLRAALHHAVKLGLIGRNPIEQVTPPRPPRKEMRPLTPEEVERFLERTKDDRFHALWAVLVTTGMRIGEATALRWEDVDLDAGKVHIRNTVKWVKGTGLVIGDAKTAGSRHPIELAPGTVAALRIHQKRQEWERRLMASAWVEQGLVFCTRTGGLLDRGTVSAAKDRALAAAGLPHVRTHDLRHTAATYLLGQGVHPKVVQDLLGHSTIAQTMNTYSHVLPSLHKEVAAHMDQLFRARESAS